MDFKQCKVLPYSKSTRENHLDHRIRLDNIANTISCGVGGSSQSTCNFVKFTDKDGKDQFRLFSINETERVMSWPSDWTKYGTDNNNKKYEIPINARYRACGNGIVSNVPKAILEKLIPPNYVAQVYSTFSGVNGSAMSLCDKRFRKVAFSEFDPKHKSQHAANILKFHYPTIQNYGDITKTKSIDLPSFNLMFTSPPCQSFSSAGKRNGLGDIRGTLFSEVVRILKDHEECEYLFFENVKGLVEHDKGRTFLVMLEAFSDIGFDLDFEICNSKHFGIPQTRERVYLFGVRKGSNSVAPPEVRCSLVNPKKIASLPMVSRLKEKIHDNYPRIKLKNFNIPLSSSEPMRSWSSILDKKKSINPIQSKFIVRKVISEGVYSSERINLKTPKNKD